MSKPRVSWKDYFMNIAREVATRSTCVRKHVGAVIVRKKQFFQQDIMEVLKVFHIVMK